MSRQRALFFKALGDETRQRILVLLQRRRELCVNDLCDLLEGLSQPTVSHHLQILRNTQIVHTRRDGKLIYYQVNREFISKTGYGYFEEILIEE